MSLPRSIPSELLHLAETALDEGRPEATLELCRQFLEADPSHVGALLLEAEAWRDLRDAFEAEDRYRRVVDLDPKRSEAWSGMGASLLDQCRFQDARACFARALRLRADNAEAYYGRATLREWDGDSHGAARDYLRAWRLSERYPIPIHCDDTAWVSLLAEAAALGTPAAQAWVSVAPVIVVDQPDPQTCDAYDPPASPVELLGHLVAPLGEDIAAMRTTWPATLVLYRCNLARYGRDREQLVQALRDGLISQVDEFLAMAAIEA